MHGFGITCRTVLTRLKSLAYKCMDLGHGFGTTRRAGREVSDGKVILSVLQGKQASGKGIPG